MGQKRGHYSGSARLNENDLEETTFDTPLTEKQWFQVMIKDSEFHQSIRQQLREWKQKISPSINPSDLNVHIVTQSHLDMAWLWRYGQTRKKAQVTLQKAIYYSKKYPNQFKFAVSSPQILAWIQEDAPDLFQEIKDYHKSGHLELVGGSWVEPDCMMPCGESMIRQRLYGMRFYQRHFDHLPKVEWFLDSFGYNVGLPQILAKSGAQYFWTSKLTWNKETHFPFVHFWWQSPDGTRLLTTNFGQYKEVFHQWDKNAVGRFLLAPHGKRLWDHSDDYSKYANHINRKKFVPDVGYFVGHGDGGHGPTHKDMAELLILLKIAPTEDMRFHWSSVHAFFNHLAQFQDGFPIWKDELYLETHRGTFSVQSEVKRHNRRLENKIRAVETLCTLQYIKNPSFSYPQEELERIWKLILLNQFHDVLPGSSIPEVYDDVYEIWNDCDFSLNKILTMRRKTPKKSESTKIIIFNPLSWTRHHRVFIPVDYFTSKIELDSQGRPPKAILSYNNGKSLYTIPCQPVAAEYQDDMHNNHAGWWTILKITPFEILSAKLIFEPYHERNVLARANHSFYLDNNIVKVEIDPKNGGISFLSAKTISEKKNLVYGHDSFTIVGYEDKGYDGYPAWNLSREYWKFPKNYPQDENLQIKIAEKGPIFSSLQIEKTLGTSKIIQTIRLFKDDPIVYMTWATDWKDKDTMLKLNFDTKTLADKVYIDGMYCVHSASTLPENPNDKARYEKIMHEFLDISTPDDQWGLAFLNEGKYAFDCSAGRIRLTLHRAVKYPRPSGESWVRLERKERRQQEKSRPPKYSGLGPTSARLALFPHVGSCNPRSKRNITETVKKRAREFNSPLIVLKGTDFRYQSEEKLICEEILPENISITALKTSEWKDGERAIIIRFHEMAGKKVGFQIKFTPWFSSLIHSVYETDLLDRPLGPQTIEPSSTQNSFTLTFTPFEIRSFKILLKNS